MATKINKRYILIAIAGLLVISNAVSAQNKDRLKLVNARLLRIEKQGDETVQMLEGDVLFTQGAATMSCDEAIRYEKRGDYVFIGNVQIDTGKRKLFADRVLYNEFTRIEQAIGHAVIHDSARTLWGNSIVYNEYDEMAIAENNVVLMDSIHTTTLTCGRIEYWRASGYAKAYIRPCLTKVDSTGSDSIQIRGKTMEVFDSGARAVVKDSVKITQRDLRATCDEAEYLDEEHKIVMTGSPFATRKLDEMVGVSFELNLDEAELKEFVIIGDALMTSPIDSLQPGKRINRLSGQIIKIKIEENHITQISVEEQGRSIYYVVDDNKYQGVNNVIGDIIHLFFADDKLQRVRIESSPGKTAGTFFPPKLEQKVNEKGGAKRASSKSRKTDTEKEGMRDKRREIDIDKKRNELIDLE